MNWTPPTVDDFQAFFNRDFPYAPPGVPATNWDYVQPSDIQRAINEALINFKPTLFGSCAQATNIFYYTTAFSLVENLKNSALGKDAQANFPTLGQSVGGINVTYQIPERYLKSAILAPYTRNAYGMRFLDLVLPYLVGNVRIAPGTTTAT